MNALNMDKARREAVRWHLLQIGNVSRPQAINLAAMLPIIQTVYHDATMVEMRRQCDYLEERGLLKIARDPLDQWMVDLTRDGIDVVEYTVECDPGIARPKIVGG